MPHSLAKHDKLFKADLFQQEFSGLTCWTLAFVVGCINVCNYFRMKSFVFSFFLFLVLQFITVS